MENQQSKNRDMSKGAERGGANMGLTVYDKNEEEQTKIKNFLRLLEDDGKDAKGAKKGKGNTTRLIVMQTEEKKDKMEMDEIKNRLRHLEKARKKEKNKVKRLERQVLSLRFQFGKTLTNKLWDLKTESTTSKQKIEELSEEIAKVVKERDDYKETMEKLEDMLKEKKSEKKAAEEERDDYKVKLDEKKKLLAESKSKNERAVKERDDYKKMLKTKHSEKRVAGKKIDKYKKKLDEKEKLLAESKSANDKTMENIEYYKEELKKAEKLILVKEVLVVSWIALCNGVSYYFKKSSAAQLENTGSGVDVATVKDT